MKTNKLKIIIAAIFAVIGLNASAQKCGVYKTYEDYSNGKMEVFIDCANKDGKIKPNDFFKTDYVTVIKNGEKIDLKKDEIFGYQLCNGDFFRFLNNNRLTLVDKSGLWIFSKEVVVSHSPFTGTEKVTNYYFSKDGSREIKSLTFSNLKDALPDNKVLFSEMELLFSSNSALHARNQSTGSFKINSFLNSKGL
ncbi:hypothetical protein AQPE_4044 [Aquipluma nitroreducens]|jgi:hypothetical protein|uniref:Uncharacterized protein n=1 Tax=Aquipluma nitroreducens TaxID=2010828 RepID=A0A5K7SEG2_9BACT|nr:hypothetical protein [Aquipluma nitroreducens]BBE19856.1 hypothetical protein AQPE_4044 [Aquipluma nitroreducens]